MRLKIEFNETHNNTLNGETSPKIIPVVIEVKDFLVLLHQLKDEWIIIYPLTDITPDERVIIVRPSQILQIVSYP